MILDIWWTEWFVILALARGFIHRGAEYQLWRWVLVALDDHLISAGMKNQIHSLMYQ
jgi:hypothetical protein